METLLLQTKLYIPPIRAEWSRSLNVLTPWLPTSMAIELIGPLFLDNQLSDEALLAGVGLVIYIKYDRKTGSIRNLGGDRTGGRHTPRH